MLEGAETTVDLNALSPCIRYDSNVLELQVPGSHNLPGPVFKKFFLFHFNNL